MKAIVFLTYLFVELITSIIMIPQQSFLENQKTFERVRIAVAEKEDIVSQNLKHHNLSIDNFRMLIVHFKYEQIIEIYGSPKEGDSFRKIATYKVCARSGGAGPKRKQGDLQVPEGFYHIDRFNPASSFYLSLGINYPNDSDRKKSNARNLGGDIFIHGSCATIGCIPLTDDKIKEVYLYAINAKNNGQVHIPVYIFPFRMNAENDHEFTESYKSRPELISFWDNLRHGYDLFQDELKPLKISIDGKGNYCFE